MARVDIMLNGRSYGLACGEGQEARLRELGAYVDARLREVARDVAGGSEAQLLVLTALVLADEVFDLRTASRNAPPPAAETAALKDETIIAAVDSLAKRIEDIAARLERS